jgi:hypothetical protein
MVIVGRKLKKKYHRIFKMDPVAASLLFLLAELADQDGNIIFQKEPGVNKEQLITLLQIRFNDPFSWQLGGKR